MGKHDMKILDNFSNSWILQYIWKLNLAGKETTGESGKGSEAYRD